MYNNPQLYDDIMWWKKDDITFWLSMIKRKKSTKILELCCGTGRIGLPLINAGLNYYGLDLSANFINYFKSKITNSNYNLDHISIADATEFNLNKTFDFIFIGFNSLAHFLTNQDIKNCLNAIKNHMHDKTILAIDIFVPDSSFLYRDDNKKIDIMDFINSANNEKIHILESINYNTSTEINYINWEFINENDITRFHYQFDMRMYFPDTLHRLLIDSNYLIKHFYGDYNCNAFNHKSEKQIYLCKHA